jgi:hypothetical protein
MGYSQIKHEIGNRYGRLFVSKEAGCDPYGNRQWHCVCDCGNEKVVIGMNLRKGLTKSCGCLHKEIAKEEGKKTATHGKALTPAYRTWIAMVRRCTKRTDQAWVKYGGVGITVCDRWINSFENFFEDMGERPNGMTLDRINPFNGYAPDNCRWADPKTQANNTKQKFLKEYGLCSVFSIPKRSLSV